MGLRGVPKAMDNVDINKIRAYLEDNNYKITTVSQTMGYDKSYLGAILAGKSKISKPAYKMLCMILKVDEDNFIKKEEVPQTPQAVNATPTVINSGITPEQLNAMLLQVSTMSDALVKSLDEITKTLNAQTLMIGQLRLDFQRFSKVMGVKDEPTGTVKTMNDGYAKPATLKR